jgi:hypothetical protein
MTGMIRSLSRLNAGGVSANSEQILNGPAMSASLAKAPGIKSVSISNVNPTTIEGPIALTRIDDFLRISPLSTQENERFITYEHTAAGGRIKISLSRAVAPRLVSVLSPDVASYLGALMAPVATGEFMSKAEYLLLVRSVYGKGIADEIAGARIQVAVDFPKPIGAIAGGVISRTQKNRGEFDILLADLLVMEGPLEYEVSW